MKDRTRDMLDALALQPASTAPLAAGLPFVQGRCPACGRVSLFLGNGGYVTCSVIDCPNPNLADEQLHGEQPVKAATEATQPGYCPACGRGDCAPTADEYEQQRRKAVQAEAAVARVESLLARGPIGTCCDHLVRAALNRATPVPAATEATDTETTARALAGMHASAEQTVNRVIDLYERWLREGPPKLGTLISREWDRRLAELHAAIQPPAISPDTVEGPGAVPAAIKQIVDRAAGKDHSATGAVMTCLSEVLAAHRQIMHAETAKPGPCPSCRRADQAGLAADEQHPECTTPEQPT